MGQIHTGDSHLILFRPPRQVEETGVTVISRGQGVYVYDQQGHEYLDLVAGVTRPVHVGYGREELARAAFEQARELAYFTPMGFSNPAAEELARRLAGLLPGAVDKFIFVCDGSEAVETAMKLAKQHHYYRGEKQRYKVVSRRGAYHGVAAAGLRALGTVYPMRTLSEPLPPGAIFIESPYCYRCPYRLEYPACDLWCARELKRVLEFEGPELVSAFIGEPVQQGFGALSPPPEYWPLIAETCAAYGVKLIIDEVICGFGRTGRWFGHQHFQVEPDLVTMAKGLTSGYVPLGAVGTTRELLKPIQCFEHLHTYGNHPVACATGIKNLEILEGEELIANSARMGSYFLEALKELEEIPIVGQVRGVGLWLGLDLTTDRKTRAPFPLDRLAGLVTRAKQKGVIIKFMGMALEIAPPLTIGRDDIDRGVAVLRQCLWEEARDMGLA